MTQTTRRITEYGLLLLILLIPLLGLFRIDLSTGRFLVAGYEVWWSDFFIVLPFWFLLILGMLTFYTAFGMIFCGWLCPQNTISELGTKVVQKFLGKRAKIGLDSIDAENQKIKQQKMKNPLNWIAVGLIFLLVSCLLAFLPLPFFFSLEEIKTLFTVEDSPVISTYYMSVAVIFLDIALIRHFWCKYMCVYAVWQYFFHNKATLGIGFAKAREEECAGCNLCRVSCFLGIDPRKTDTYTHCINCGECIDACGVRTTKTKTPPLLSFRFGAGDSGKIEGEGVLKKALVKSLAVPVGLLLFIGSLLGYGVATYDPTYLALVQDDKPKEGSTFADQKSYLIRLANKGKVPEYFTLSLEGLSAGDYQRDDGWDGVETKEDGKLFLKVNPRKQQVLHFTLKEGDPSLKKKLSRMTITAVRQSNGKEYKAQTTFYR